IQLKNNDFFVSFYGFIIQAYEAFIQEQKKADGKDEIYAAITTTSGDGSEVLLIADEITEGVNQATKADVYSYADGKVTKICEIESTSSAYPIGSLEDKYLVTGSHHTVEHYLVSGDAADVEKVEGVAMEEGNYKMSKYTVSNDEISNAEEEELSVEIGDEFVNTTYEGWKPIEFTQY
ncbi:MAG: hypothetical protein Q4E53_14510, partial [Eubacteriales bacterium]|nr:hypothetical protein [Eubacteriales bacterium]